MPNMQAMIERANFTFNRENIGAVDATLFEPGKPLTDALTTLGIARTAAEMAFLMRFPKAELERIRVTIADALDETSEKHKGYRMPIQSVWISATDFKTEYFQSEGRPESIGGVSMIIRTPYP